MFPFPEVHSHRLHRNGGSSGKGLGLLAVRLHGDLARYREFQEGMARLTAWLASFNAPAARVREFLRTFEGRPR